MLRMEKQPKQVRTVGGGTRAVGATTLGEFACTRSSNSAQGVLAVPRLPTVPYEAEKQSPPLCAQSTAPANAPSLTTGTPASLRGLNGGGGRDAFAAWCLRQA